MPEIQQRSMAGSLGGDGTTATGWTRSGAGWRRLHYVLARPDWEYQLIGQGHEGRNIASRLNISHKTVDAHRGHLKDKLA